MTALAAFPALWVIVPAASLVLSWIIILVRIEDAPDGQRKLQAAPVPSSGGVAILAALSLGIAFAVKTGGGGWLIGDSFAVWAAALLAGGVGLVDDVRGLPALVKMGALLVIALGLALAGASLSVFQFPWAELPLPAWLAVIGVTAWLFVMMNAVNFMDGSNGLAIGSAAFMLAGMAFILAPANALAILAGLSCLGFLAWNLAGKLYAGDAGALSLGLIVAGTGISVAEKTDVWTAAIIVLPFLVDVFMTLIWRARRGQNLLEAHRDHAYQQFIRAGAPHLVVGALWWGMSALCALTAVLVPEGQAFWAFIILLSIGTALWSAQRATLGKRVEAAGTSRPG